MLDDMKLRNMAVSTRKIYVSSVAGFSAYHGRSPDQKGGRTCGTTSCTWSPAASRPASICPIMSPLADSGTKRNGLSEADLDVPAPPAYG